MKQVSIFLVFILLTSFSPKSQNILTIEISSLNSNKGKVLIELSDSEKNFVKGISAEIVKHTCIVTVDSLKAGKYSFKFFHDENNNNKLDTNWVGIPKEGFGFSNNARGTIGPPSFKKTIFDFKGVVSQKCTPLYY